MNPIRFLGKAAAVAGLLAVSACTGSTDFTISKTFTPNATANTTYTSTQNVDLAADAPDAWKHRNKVKSLDLVGIDATATSISVPFTGSGSIVLQRAGWTDQTIGQWPGESVAAAPHSISVTLQPAAVALIMDAVKGDGKFTVVLTGMTDVDVSFTADVSLHLKLKFKVP
jgi:hypothetical protein